MECLSLQTRHGPGEPPGYMQDGCFQKQGFFTPQIIHFNRVFHYKPSIWGGFPPIFGTHVSKGSNLWLYNQKFDKSTLPKPTLSVIGVLMSYFDSGS